MLNLIGYRRNRYMINNMIRIEKFEKLVDNLEKYIPTPEYIKEHTNINVISIKNIFLKHIVPNEILLLELI